jgi:hypothetical protein
MCTWPRAAYESSNIFIYSARVRRHKQELIRHGNETNKGYITRQLRQEQHMGAHRRRRHIHARHHSGIELTSGRFFVVKKRLSDVKLLRFDKRLFDASETSLNAVSGRLAGAEDLADRSGGLDTGDMAPNRPEMEPLGVLRVLLGNSPNCA